jgi:hypothetical protein
MPIFTMEIDKRAVMAFSGNYSVKAKLLADDLAAAGLQGCRPVDRT